MSNGSQSPSSVATAMLRRHPVADARTPHRPGGRWRELVQPRFGDEPPRFQWELATDILRESVPADEYERITSGDHTTRAERQGWLREIRRLGLRSGRSRPTDG